MRGKAYQPTPGGRKTRSNAALGEKSEQEDTEEVSGKAAGTSVKIPTCNGALSLVNGKYGDSTKQRAAEIE